MSQLAQLDSRLPLDGEELIDLKAAAPLLPGHPSVNTVRRYIRKGAVGASGEVVVLESIVTGHRTRKTSREAIERFVRGLNRRGE